MADVIAESNVDLPQAAPEPRKTASDLFVLPGVLDETQKIIEDAAGLAGNGIQLHRREDAYAQVETALKRLESYRSRGNSETNLRVEGLIMDAKRAASKLSASLNGKG